MAFDVFSLLIILAIIFVSMILHELAHGAVALALGDDTAKVDGRLTLNPIKHIDPFMTILVPLLLAISGGPIFGGAKPVPINPYKLKWGEWGMALVALAGPVTNFILAFLSVILLSIFASEGSILGVQICKLGYSVNMGFCIFNLMPIPPLDGSRIVYAIAPDNIRRMMANLEQYGLIIVFVLVILLSGLFGHVMTSAIYGLYDFYNGIFDIGIRL